MNTLGRPMGPHSAWFAMLCLFVISMPCLAQETGSSEAKSETDGAAVILRARKLIAEKEFDQAATILKAVTESQPENAQAWQLLGFSLHSAGKIEAAIAAHRHATEFAATEALGHYNLACAYSLQDELKKSSDHLKKAYKAGYRDLEFMKGDSDLDNLRNAGGFAGFLEFVDAENVIYVCPPCGCATCGKTYAKPGTCPDCNMELVAKSKIRNVAIVIWEGVELLDFAGPAEVFAAARSDDGQSFNVFTVSETIDPIRSQGFLQVVPNYALSDCPEIDIVVLPGGGTSNVVDNKNFMAQLKTKIEASEIALSVCTGARVLGAHGYLDDLDATTFHNAIESLQEEFPKARFHANRRYIDNGKIVTSAGVSAGIDSSLHLVARLLGKEAAVNTATYMEYHWRIAEEAVESEPKRNSTDEDD